MLVNEFLTSKSGWSIVCDAPSVKRHSVVLVGRFAYQQTMGAGQLFGIALITAGVVLVNLKQ